MQPEYHLRHIRGMGSSRLAQWGDVGTLNRGLAEELARIANAAKPKLLVLYHQQETNEDGLRVIRARYTGRVQLTTTI